MKNKVSLEETINYMKFIKNDPDAFNGKEYIPEPGNQNYSFSKSKGAPLRKPKKAEIDINDEEKRKNINKNRNWKSKLNS